jgi:hypothetical protein
MDLEQPRRQAQIRRVLAWIDAHRDVVQHAGVLVTNLKLLDAHLQLDGSLPRVDVDCFMQIDNEYELLTFSNPTNGQRSRMLQLARWRFYGRGVLPREFIAQPGPPGAIVVLEQDRRLREVDAEALVARGATVLLRVDDLTILRLLAAPTR